MLSWSDKTFPRLLDLDLYLISGLPVSWIIGSTMNSNKLFHVVAVQEEMESLLAAHVHSR